MENLGIESGEEQSKRPEQYTNNQDSNWTRLLEIIKTLREPNGCPWDREQTHQSLKPCLLEETYEVLEAIENASDPSLCDELGDLLLQVVFHSQIATEEGRFTIEDVISSVNQKMIRRHPHVFGSAEAADTQAVLSQWEMIKASEKSQGKDSRVMKINNNLPALLMAQKAQAKAARVGFDWADISGPWAKVEEELLELRNAQTQEEKSEELGDLLFAIVNLSRFLEVDAEDAMRQSVRKFINRFDYIEENLQKQGKSWDETSLVQMDELWDEAKAKE